MTQTPQPPSIYQLRLVLSKISPMVWRRFLVASETSLAQLHAYIQIIFSWSDEHLHRFRIQGKDYGIAHQGGISFSDNPHAVTLSDFRLHPRERFRYEYDFTAGWQIEIRLDKILPMKLDCRVPVCSGGRGAAPGEGYAGPLAYLQHLDRHRYEFPFEALEKMAAVIQRWLNSEGDCRAVDDLAELREAVEHVSAYQAFRPHRFNRREVNRKLLEASFIGDHGAVV